MIKYPKNYYEIVKKHSLEIKLLVTNPSKVETFQVIDYHVDTLEDVQKTNTKHYISSFEKQNNAFLLDKQILYMGSSQ